METRDREQLIATWIKHHKDSRASGAVPDDTFWAWEELDHLCSTDPTTALATILTILATDQSDVVVENLAAGPLEDLLVRHGEEFIDRIEVEATKNPAFKLLLGGVWENTMDPTVWARVQRAAG
jgi:hypothetical protein